MTLSHTVKEETIISQPYIHIYLYEVNLSFDKVSFHIGGKISEVKDIHELIGFFKAVDELKEIVCQKYSTVQEKLRSK